ncbi:MAG: hypothetical protein ACYC8T_16020 [Myxococcaceae bacterium]
MSGSREKRPKKRSAPLKEPSELSRVMAMYERTQSDVAAIAEGVLGLGRKMDEGFANIRKEFDAKIDPLTVAIRLLGQDTRELKGDVAVLKTDVSVLKDAVRQNSVDIRRVEEKLDKKADRAEVDALGARVTVLEAG